VQTDVYALGVLGYLLFTRTMPFDGNVPAILDAQVHQAPPSLSERRGERIDESIETLIMRAMSKQPALRHQSAAAFRYELNNVMRMLEMTRRQSSGSAKIDRRETAAAMLFDQSVLAQVVIRGDGTIKMANKAFAALVGEADGTLKGASIAELPISLWVPQLEETLEAVRKTHQPTELRARRWANELVLWIAPAPLNEDVHVLVQNHVIERELPRH